MVPQQLAGHHHPTRRRLRQNTTTFKNSSRGNRFLLAVTGFGLFLFSVVPTTIIMYDNGSNSPRNPLRNTEDHFLSSFYNYHYRDHQTDIYPGDPTVPTIAVRKFHKKGQGFFNQQMAFSALMMKIQDMRNPTNPHNDHEEEERVSYQVLLPSLAFRDYLGSEKLVPFERLFDVTHWNSFVPHLPRLVSYNQTQHHQYSLDRHDMIPPNPNSDDNNNSTNCSYYTSPHCIDDARGSFKDYLSYMQSLRTGNRTTLHPVDQLMLETALRPAHTVQNAIERIIGTDRNYMAVHLRIEQDFLCHNWPGGGGGDHMIDRSRNVTDIIARIERAWGPDPPSTVSRCFLAVNRPLLEDDTHMPHNPKPSREACEEERHENLRALNRVVRDGLWNGRVSVLERPSLDQVKRFRDRPVAFGSLIDAELCRHAKIFIGRLRSTFTLNTIRRRSVMGLVENYDYEGGSLEKVHGVAFPRAIHAD